jgi:predicted nucleotidyltransferase component of viral defense system
MERFLYRLANSPYADRFILKGALLMTAWKAPMSRPTMDIDFAGRTGNALDHVRQMVADVCATAVPSDGVVFAANAIEASRIKEDAQYEGVRVRFHAVISGARVPMQLDIGFDDVITPGPVRLAYPALLEFPSATLQAYPKETVIAEKLEAMTTLGLLNSRMKDYYDLVLLSRLYAFDGKLLAEAVAATFAHRGTAVEREPAGMTAAFYEAAEKVTQWRAFLKRSRLTGGIGNLDEAVRELRVFAMPLLAVAGGFGSRLGRWEPATRSWTVTPAGE